MASLKSYKDNNLKSISALIPIKNGSKFLTKLSKIVSKNMRVQDEIIVIDDNSDDSTYLELLKWAKIDSRVRVIRNKKSGLVSALNLGIKESTNTWIARFDVDDEYPSDRIQKQIASLNDGTVAVFSDYKFMTFNGASLGTVPSPISHLGVSVSLMESRRTAHPSVIFDKNAVEAVGAYREFDFPSEDLSLWLRLTRTGELASVPENLLNYRLHKQSISSSCSKINIKIRNNIVSSINLDKKLILFALESFDEILDGYTNVNFSSERKCLFVKELFTTLYHNRSIDKEVLIKKILKSNLSPRDLLKSGHLVNEALIRKMYRKFI
jgi:glycosyltransferase involved in cell wall biosynthesis